MSESGEEQRFLLRDTAALRHCERCLRFSAATELEHIAAPSESPLARPAGIVEHHREGEPQLFSKLGLRCCTSRPFLDGKPRYGGQMWLLQRKTREREYRVEVLKRLGGPLKCPHVEFERGGAQPAYRKRPAERHAHHALAGDGVRGGPVLGPQLQNHLCEPKRVQSECKQHEMPERVRVEPETKELHRV